LHFQKVNFAFFLILSNANATFEQQSISLVEASRQANTEEVESLLASGHCIDKANEDGVTACHAVVVSNIKTSAVVAVLNVQLARRPTLRQRDRRGRISRDW
jgi:hypothetical protein